MIIDDLGMFFLSNELEYTIAGNCGEYIQGFVLHKYKNIIDITIC